METARCRTPMPFLLSAVIVLGGVMPPAFQHAHPAGKSSHHHDPQSASAVPVEHRHHRHDHSHPHDHFQQETFSGMIATAQSHVHAWLLWFHIVVPVGQDENAPNAPDSIGHGGMYFAPGTASDMLTLSRTSSMSVETCLPVGFAVAHDRAAPSHPQGGRQILASIPLCDTARGERSGVQLI